MVTPEQHYEFLKKHYREQHFEGRNIQGWGENYSRIIAEYRYKDLQKYGFDIIEYHKSATNKAICYDINLNLITCLPKTTLSQRLKQIAAISTNEAHDD
ncbi:hypothetical protein [Xenorhabdus sp. KJ12.1]|uniref:hypothetical protein n=1 Tax=Xenorhabdus sp. KJ12.1 TaxID=1851571 RepID=UPI000C050BD3|nr:hypothetical protein [Xenorhabdus sp. KJ12.1]PHM72243.1 hypothetical protein Xekj_00521 [Xenorhabdus sp. KJ12.1]